MTVSNVSASAASRSASPWIKRTDSPRERALARARSIATADASRPVTSNPWLAKNSAFSPVPHLYALRNVVRSDPSDEKLIEEEIPCEVLARHRAPLIEMAKEDEQKRCRLTRSRQDVGQSALTDECLGFRVSWWHLSNWPEGHCRSVAQARSLRVAKRPYLS